MWCWPSFKRSLHNIHLFVLLLLWCVCVFSEGWWHEHCQPHHQREVRDEVSRLQLLLSREAKKGLVDTVCGGTDVLWAMIVNLTCIVGYRESGRCQWKSRCRPQWLLGWVSWMCSTIVHWWSQRRHRPVQEALAGATPPVSFKIVQQNHLYWYTLTNVLVWWRVVWISEARRRADLPLLPVRLLSQRDGRGSGSDRL